MSLKKSLKFVSSARKADLANTSKVRRSKSEHRAKDECQKKGFFYF